MEAAAADSDSNARSAARTCGDFSGGAGCNAPAVKVSRTALANWTPYFKGTAAQGTSQPCLNPTEAMDVNLSFIEIPTPAALAVLALFAYVFVILPRRARRKISGLQRDLAQAQMAICEMEEVVTAIHQSTADHCVRLRKLKGQIEKLGVRTEDAAWRALCHEVDGILAPTLKLIGEIAGAQESIRYHSSHLQQFSEVQADPLTGIGNRRALEGVVAAQFAVLKRYGTSFSLAVVDVDHFKEINDQRGHLHGDATLRDLARLLIDSVRKVDVVARFGGDEFVVVMPQTDAEGAAILAERLRERVAETMPCTVSIGIASAHDADTPEELFEHADAALYRAKSAGRNRVHCHPVQATDAVAIAAVLSDPVNYETSLTEVAI
jgi:diguanylate cyclase (GGDEF)-like protein